ncbi:MAG TPA: ABC transporter permease subunit [Gemmatales bacterium]|nr:ABC transporter permease subunit [Gemmatales bacterium]
MLGFGPLLWHEMRRLGRRRWLHGLRLAFLALLFAELLAAYVRLESRLASVLEMPSEAAKGNSIVQERLRQGGGVSALLQQAQAEVTSDFFQSLLALQALVLVILAPLLVASGIVDERRSGRLDLLRVSGLQDQEIVAGQLLARVMLLALFSLGTVPILLLTMLLGGIDPELAVGSYVMLLSTLLSLAALTLLVSLRVGSLPVTLVLILGLVGGMALLGWANSEAYQLNYFQAGGLCVNPFQVLWFLQTTQEIDGTVGSWPLRIAVPYALVHVLGAWLFARAAVRAVPQPVAAGLPWWQRWLFTHERRPVPEDRPVWWKESQSGGLGRLSRRGLITLIVAGLLGAGLWFGWRGIHMVIELLRWPVAERVEELTQDDIVVVRNFLLNRLTIVRKRMREDERAGMLQNYRLSSIAYAAESHLKFLLKLESGVALGDADNEEWQRVRQSCATAIYAFDMSLLRADLNQLIKGLLLAAALACAVRAAVSVTREKERQTWDMLLTTPLLLRDLLAAKFLASLRPGAFALAFMAGLMTLGVMVGTWEGKVFVLLPFCLAYILAAATMGFVLSVASANSTRALLGLGVVVVISFAVPLTQTSQLTEQIGSARLYLFKWVLVGVQLVAITVTPFLGLVAVVTRGPRATRAVAWMLRLLGLFILPIYLLHLACLIVGEGAALLPWNICELLLDPMREYQYRWSWRLVSEGFMYLMVTLGYFALSVLLLFVAAGYAGWSSGRIEHQRRPRRTGGGPTSPIA